MRCPHVEHARVAGAVPDRRRGVGIRRAHHVGRAGSVEVVVNDWGVRLTASLDAVPLPVTVGLWLGVWLIAAL